MTKRLRNVGLRLSSTFLVRYVQPLEAFYEQSGFVPSKVKPAPAGFAQFCAFGAAGILVMAYGSDVVRAFRRVAGSPTQCPVGQSPDMAPCVGNCKSGSIRRGGNEVNPKRSQPSAAPTGVCIPL